MAGIALKPRRHGFTGFHKLMHFPILFGSCCLITDEPMQKEQTASPSNNLLVDASVEAMQYQQRSRGLKLQESVSERYGDAIVHVPSSGSKHVDTGCQANFKDSIRHFEDMLHRPSYSFSVTQVPQLSCRRFASTSLSTKSSWSSDCLTLSDRSIPLTYKRPNVCLPIDTRRSGRAIEVIDLNAAPSEQVTNFLWRKSNLDNSTRGLKVSSLPSLPQSMQTTKVASLKRVSDSSTLSPAGDATEKSPKEARSALASLSHNIGQSVQSSHVSSCFNRREFLKDLHPDESNLKTRAGHNSSGDITANPSTLSAVTLNSTNTNGSGSLQETPSVEVGDDCTEEVLKPKLLAPPNSPSSSILLSNTSSASVLYKRYSRKILSPEEKISSELNSFGDNSESSIMSRATSSTKAFYSLFPELITKLENIESNSVGDHKGNDPNTLHPEKRFESLEGGDDIRVLMKVNSIYSGTPTSSNLSGSNEGMTRSGSEPVFPVHSPLYTHREVASDPQLTPDNTSPSLRFLRRAISFLSYIWSFFR